ncbi:MAG: hypothetical protein M1812_005693 [Candelaria pacifica]|nr:MAG: hypothetical protein M1812_005693 [Candelaria pacifica]
MLSRSTKAYVACKYGTVAFTSDVRSVHCHDGVGSRSADLLTKIRGRAPLPAPARQPHGPHGPHDSTVPTSRKKQKVNKPIAGVSKRSRVKDPVRSRAHMEEEYGDISVILTQLQKPQDLSIIKLSEPLLAELAAGAGKRQSDVSADAYENATPSSLEADLSHYKELFSKLRFSYLEQVTKEKFLRAIVGDPPLIVEHQENVDLEAELAEVKASLKAQKIEVADMVTELERSGRDLTRRYQNIQLQTAQLESLPEQISDLQATIAELQASQAPISDKPSLSMPLPATLSLLSTREEELAHLNHQLAALQSTLPRKTRELDRLEAELKPLEIQKLGTTAAAKEARRRKEDGMGGVGDDLEERGRWWRGVEGSLKAVLEVEGQSVA